MLNREDFIKPRPPKLIPVNVPDLGGAVYIRVPTAAEFEKHQQRQSKQHAAGLGGIGLRARIAILVCADEKGDWLFTPADEAALSALPLTALDAIFAAASPILGFSEKAKDDAEKNLPATTGDDSTSD